MKWHVVALAGVTILMALPTEGPAAQVEIRPGGTLAVDGEPFFPLFVWLQPVRLIEQHRDLGMNTLMGEGASAGSGERLGGRGVDHAPRPWGDSGGRARLNLRGRGWFEADGQGLPADTGRRAGRWSRGALRHRVRLGMQGRLESSRQKQDDTEVACHGEVPSQSSRFRSQRVRPL